MLQQLKQRAGNAFSAYHAGLSYPYRFAGKGTIDELEVLEGRKSVVNRSLFNSPRSVVPDEGDAISVVQARAPGLLERYNSVLRPPGEDAGYVDAMHQVLGADSIWNTNPPLSKGAAYVDSMDQVHAPDSSQNPNPLSQGRVAYQMQSTQPSYGHVQAAPWSVHPKFLTSQGHPLAHAHQREGWHWQNLMK